MKNALYQQAKKEDSHESGQDEQRGKRAGDQRSVYRQSRDPAGRASARRQQQFQLWNCEAKHWNGHICSPGNAMVGILQPDDGNEGVLHVSHGCAGKVVHSPSAAGGVVVRLNPTHSFFELKLAAGPVEVAGAAQTRARYDLWNANQELAKLDYSDVRYAPLYEILNQAVTEWQKGWFYTDEAGETRGKDEATKWAQAIRCHTRCQCYARQVQNSLIPPATCPEGLGLRPWQGNWGEWALRNGHLPDINGCRVFVPIRSYLHNHNTGGNMHE